MRHHLSRHCACAQLLAVVLLLAGCATTPTVVAVKTPIAPAPEACRGKPKPLPPLPDAEMTNAELAQAYARLKVRYLRENGRYALCQAYVGRLVE
jgi:hypothetical protein